LKFFEISVDVPKKKICVTTYAYERVWSDEMGFSIILHYRSKFLFHEPPLISIEASPM
jgi:hypothetical protein